MAMLEIEGLTASYRGRSGRGAVRGVSLALDAADWFLVHGHNGSGKSTLLKALAGLMPLTGGTVRWRGQPVAPTRSGAPAHPWVGIQFQSENTFPSLTVCDHFRLAGARGDEAERLIGALPGLAENWGRRAGLLSGGQRRLLGLALALIGEPLVLLLDEPLAGLSPTSREVVTGLLTERKQAGAALLQVEHGAEGFVGAVTARAEMIDGQLFACPVLTGGA